MASPNITMTDINSAALPSLQFGNVDANSTSDVQTVYIWNNQGGSQALSDATSTTITTKTRLGLDIGDTIANGQEVVTNLYLQKKCTSLSEGSFTPTGGPTTASIGSSVGGTGVISGSINGDNAIVALRIAAPSNVTQGPVQFIIRVNYFYI